MGWSTDVDASTWDTRAAGVYDAPSDAHEQPVLGLLGIPRADVSGLPEEKCHFPPSPRWPWRPLPGLDHRCGTAVSNGRPQTPINSCGSSVLEYQKRP